jgi:hypothetical protein
LLLDPSQGRSDDRHSHQCFTFPRSKYQHEPSQNTPRVEITYYQKPYHTNSMYTPVWIHPRMARRISGRITDPLSRWLEVHMQIKPQKTMNILSIHKPPNRQGINGTVNVTV